MTYEITITEIRKAVVDVEADSYEEAVEKLEAKYWENPIEYDCMLEPRETVFEAAEKLEAKYWEDPSACMR